MANDGRRTAASVEDLIFGAPGRIDVFQLVRLLRMRGRVAGGTGERPGHGFERRLRFRADLSAGFPGEEVTRCQPVASAAGADDGHSAVEIETANYCVASELGPLPEPFLEWVRDRLRDDDVTFAAFLDVFNHRIHVLRHRLKAGQEFALDNALPQHTRQAHFLASVAGIASRGADAQIVLPRRAWLGIASILADTRRSGAGALLALRRYLGVPDAQLEPLVGSWRKLLPVDRPLLGMRAMTLGRDAVLGTHVWNQGAGVRLTVPDVDYARLCALLPSGTHPFASTPLDASAAAIADDAAAEDSQAQSDANGVPPVDGHAGLAQMVRLLFDRRIDCQVTLTIRARDLPPPMLTARDDQPLPGWPAAAGARVEGAARDVRYRGLRLGQTAWLGAAADVPDDVRRTVTFTIIGDPPGVPT